MIKLILVIVLSTPLGINAKSYTTTMTPCDIGSNCKKCYEVVKVNYSIEINKKQVIASSADSTGKSITDEINNCTITDVNNWSCNTAAFVIRANNSVVTVQNTSNSSLASNNKEICLIN